MANDQQQIDAPPQVSDVRPDTQERVLKGVGGFLTGAVGKTLTGTPLEQAIQAHHQRRLDEANLHMKTASTLAGGLAMLNQNIDPETHQHFDDPAYNGRGKDVLQREYQNNYDTAKGAFEKIAGVDKDTKAAIQRNQVTVDNLIKTGAKGKVAPPPQASAAGGAAAPAAGASSTAAAAAGGGSGAPGTNLTPPPAAGATAPPIASDQTATSSGGAKITGAAGPVMTPPAQPQATADTGVTPTAAQGPSARDLAMMAPQMRKQMAEAQEDARKYAEWKREATTAHEFKMAEIREAAVSRSLYPYGRASAMSPISMTEARKLAEQGKAFRAADGGDELDLKNYDDTMMLVPLQINGKIVGYSPASQKQTHLAFNNEVIAVPSLNQMDAATGAGTVLGAKNVPVTTTHTAPGITLSGDIGNVTTSSTRTPQGGTVTPGPTGQPKTAGAPAGGTGGTPRPSKNGISAPPSASGGAQENKPIPFAAANQLNQRIVPVREAASQVLGDPTRPEMKSLKDFADIADNPAERAALANAVKLTFDGIKTNEDQAGGLASLLKNYGGVPQALVASQTQVLQDVIGKLSPRNREAYNATMASYGTMIGIRSLTKASAAQFSTKALERELPIPGLNSFSSKQYYDQLSHIAEEIRNGSRTLPINKDEKAYYDRQVKEFRDKATGAGAGTGSADLSKLTPEARKWIADHAH